MNTTGEKTEELLAAAWRHSGVSEMGRVTTWNNGTGEKNNREKTLKQQGLSEKISGNSKLSRPREGRKAESLSIHLSSLCQGKALRTVTVENRLV